MSAGTRHFVRHYLEMVAAMLLRGGEYSHASHRGGNVSQEVAA